MNPDRAQARADELATRLKHRMGRTRPRGNNPGFDIKSFDGNGDLLFIEVKGRLAGADTVTVTRNEILHGLNSADRFILALVEVHPDGGEEVRYLRRPFDGIDTAFHFAETSRTFNWHKLRQAAKEPA